MPSGDAYRRIRQLKESKSLHTVCEEAGCPNMGECWERGHATFLILGNTCTRDCRFCKVRSGSPDIVDPAEAVHVAEAVAAMGLRHAVVTSVTRDDLPDGGAHVFSRTIREIRRHHGTSTVEILIPDFRGDPGALRTVVTARPEILGHNMETVLRLYNRVRPGADYARSLRLLRDSKEMEPSLTTKSGIMVGLGEKMEEILEVMADLRWAGCDILTIGQYLSPSKTHLPVARYYEPEEFRILGDLGRKAGFRRVESGPLVRSSYI